MEPPSEPKRRTTDSPLVFISHDGRDADLAEAFGNLLTDASGGILKSFRSSDRKGNAGIEYGQEWYQAIMQKLDDATDVVALLTARSIGRPWILYEAGVAKGKLAINGRVFGIALGVTLEEAATGPFAQFQNSPDEEDAITSLIVQLIRRHPEASPREEAVRRQVQAFRESVATLLKGRKEERLQAVARVDETSVAKFFEEIKVIVGDLPNRVARELGTDPGARRLTKLRRIDTVVLNKILRGSTFRDVSDPGLPILIAFSMLRDVVPWLYHLGVQMYQAIDEGELRAIERERRHISNTATLMDLGLLDDLESLDPDDYLDINFLLRSVDEIVRFIQEPKRRREDEPQSDEKTP